MPKKALLPFEARLKRFPSPMQLASATVLVSRSSISISRRARTKVRSWSRYRLQSAVHH